MEQTDDFKTIFNNTSYASAVNGDFVTADNKKQGSIQIITSAGWVGTTSAVALLGSNDNVNFGTVYQNDGTTAVSLTLAAASSTYTVELEKILYKFYRCAYTPGNASAGAFSANYIGK